MFNLRPRPPVHCSRKEVRRLLGVGHSQRQAADVLDVSQTQLNRVSKGYRCRCLACPPARTLDELLAVVPRKRRAPPEQEKEGWASRALNTIGAGLVLWKTMKEAQAPPEDEEKHPFL